mgnify:FL=1
MNCVFESVFVEIVQPNNEKNILGCLYKPLTFTLKSFMMELNKSLLKLALRINHVSFLYPKCWLTCPYQWFHWSHVFQLITLKIFVPIFVLLIGISPNLPLQMHCTILLCTVFIQSMKHAFLLRLSPSKKVQKPNLGLPQGSRTPVVGS